MERSNREIKGYRPASTVTCTGAPGVWLEEATASIGVSYKSTESL
jgi:hypothetical protein